MQSLEEEARAVIDEKPLQAGWIVQDIDKVRLGASRSGTLRQFLPIPQHWDRDPHQMEA
jgi:hypothetical protein